MRVTQYWLWHAIAHHAGVDLASGFGRRTDDVCLRLETRLEPLGIIRYSPDGYGTDERHGDAAHHTVGKAHMQRLESKHSTWRPRSKRWCAARSAWQRPSRCVSWSSDCSSTGRSTGKLSEMRSTTLQYLPGAQRLRPCLVIAVGGDKDKRNRAMVPNAATICLLSKPETTSRITSCSRGVSLS